MMFKSFRMGDVFYKVDAPKVKGTSGDFPAEYSSEYCVPLLMSGTENQGLNRYAKPSDCSAIISDAVSVSEVSGSCYYQPTNFAVLSCSSYAVKMNGCEIECVEEGLYLACALKKAIGDNHDWLNPARWEYIQGDNIVLPIKS